MVWENVKNISILFKWVYNRDERKNKKRFIEIEVISISKTGNAIRMAMLLQSRGKMKISELAKELEVSERQIRNYRSDLEIAGIYINSEQGPYGGYTLMNNGNLLGLNLSLEELSVIDLALEQLKYNKYIYSDEFKNVADKIKAVTHMKKDLEGNSNYIYVEAKASCDMNKEKQKWQDINIAFITKNKVKIKYFSLNSGLTSRVVHPYGVYQYKSDMYIVAYCENREAIIDFKMCRIKEYEILSEKFKIRDSFNWDNYMKNCIGIYKDEEINLKLEIKYPLSVIISEKIWVDNQKIIVNNEDKSIIFEAKMKGYKEIKSWILSMGGDAIVLEPEKLRSEIKNEIEKLIKEY